MTFNLRCHLQLVAVEKRQNEIFANACSPTKFGNLS